MGVGIEFVKMTINHTHVHDLRQLIFKENVSAGRTVCLRTLVQHRTAVVSLHGCGDLQPILLQEFARSPNTNEWPVLVSIGCCYHKMTLNAHGWQADVCTRTCTRVHRYHVAHV
jgi:hypothetical protein